MMNVHADRIVANEFVGENINKANIDLDNLSEKGKKAFFPSSSYLTIVSGSFDTIRYVAPANGFIVVRGVSNIPNGDVARLYILGRTFSIENTNTHNVELAIYTPVTKNETIIIVSYNANLNNSAYARFFYSEGELQ